MSKNLFTVLFPTLQMSQHLTAVMDLRQRQHTTHINFTCLSLWNMALSLFIKPDGTRRWLEPPLHKWDWKQTSWVSGVRIREIRPAARLCCCRCCYTCQLHKCSFLSVCQNQYPPNPPPSLPMFPLTLCSTWHTIFNLDVQVVMTPGQTTEWPTSSWRGDLSDFVMRLCCRLLFARSWINFQSQQKYTVSFL